MDERHALELRLNRERRARREAERLLEEKSRALFVAVEESKRLTDELQQTVGFQTRELLNAQRVARVGTLVWDIDADLITWSDGVYSILGIDPEREPLSVKRYLSAVHWEDRPQLRAQITDSVELGLEAGSEFQTTHRIVRPDGTVHWVKGRGEITQAGDQSRKFMFAALQDVTTLKRADDEIKQAHDQLEKRLTELEETRKILENARDEAQTANLTKSRFIAMISHEIRTPINGLLGTLTLLRDSELDVSQQELLNVAVASAETLRVLLNDVIDFARLETDEIQLEPANFEIRELVYQLAEFWRPQATANGNQLDVHVDDEVPTTLRGDPTRIGQILNNLLSNSIKFTTNGSITTRIMSENFVPAARFHRYLKIEVTDTGIGISRQDQTSLFQEFSQITAIGESTNRFYDSAGKSHGAGLGLAICRALADQMGGKISVVSATGEGSTFCVRLPLEIATDNPTPRKERLERTPLTTANRTRPRALIAEDVPANQLVARMLLERFGCTADIANDGVEAVAACKRQHYDFVLMDVSMPRLDGVDATIQIRAIPDETVASVPIIGLTAFAFTDEIDKLYKAGMNRVISKPVQREILYEEIKSVLSPDTVRNDALTKTSEQSDVNFDFVEDLIKGFSDHQITRVFEQVSDDLDKYRRNAITSAKDGNVVELGRSCHAVKGLAASFGGEVLADLAQQIEAFAVIGDGESAFATTLDRLNSTTDAALAAFGNYTKSLTARSDRG